jgi:predicted CopG family antitoxin
MAATKRIPVSEETWKKLGKEKEPGQTWDELLEDLRVQKEKAKTLERLEESKNGEMKGKNLDEL